MASAPAWLHITLRHQSPPITDPASGGRGGSAVDSSGLAVCPAGSDLIRELCAPGVGPAVDSTEHSRGHHIQAGGQRWSCQTVPFFRESSHQITVNSTRLPPFWARLVTSHGTVCVCVCVCMETVLVSNTGMNVSLCVWRTVSIRAIRP